MARPGRLRVQLQDVFAIAPGDGIKHANIPYVNGRGGGRPQGRALGEATNFSGKGKSHADRGRLREQTIRVARHTQVLLEQ
jgi:hypothetical protein